MPDARRYRTLAEAAGLAVIAAFVSRFQAQFPITLGPDWLLAAAYGVPFTAGLLLGVRGVPAVFVGIAAAVLAGGVGGAAAAAGLAAAAAEAGLAAWWARRGLPFAAGLDRPRDVFALAVAAAAAACGRGVAATVAAAAAGLPAPVPAGAGAAAVGLLANLLVAPAAVLWLRGAPVAGVTPRRLAEAAASAGLTIGLTYLWFAGPAPRTLALPLPMFAVLLTVGYWVAYRFHSRGMVTLVPLVAAVIVAGAAGRGTFEPLVPAATPPVEQVGWLIALAGVVVAHYLIAAAARDYRLREEDRDEWVRETRTQADRLRDVNARLAVQSIELADQAAELDRQQRAARDSEERLRFALRSARMIAWEWDLDTGRVTRSDPIQAWLGLPPDAPFHHAEFQARLHPGDRPAFEAALQTVRAAGQEFALEYRLLRADGTPVWVSSRGEVVAGPDGRPARMVGIHLDVTARRVSEDRLRLLESAVVHAHDAVIVLEADPHPGAGRRVLYVNAAFTRITGYAADEVRDRSLHFLRGPGTDPATLDRLRVALDAHAPFRGELLNYRKDGAAVWVDLSLVPVAGSDGRCTHFVMIQRDVTRRKQAEAAVRESEERLRSIVEATPECVKLVAADGTLLHMNPAGLRIIEADRLADVAGGPVDGLVVPEHRAAWRALHDRVIAGGRESLAFDLVGLRGTRRHMETHAVPVRLPDGATAHLAVARDVTARRALEEQLRQAQKMEALGQLAGGIAHDFNNLLTAVLGNLGLVRLPPDDPNRGLLRTVEQAATRAADLTRKLLGYARRNQLLVAPVRPAEMITEVVDILRRTLDPRIEIRLDVRTDAVLTADATLINQALFNLCLNARDAMPGGGVLTLAADTVIVTPGDAVPPGRPGRHVRLSVTDTGCGMPDEIRARLFEPFFTTKGVGKGTGLGLPMVHGIMTQHKGWVTVETAVGRGSRFNLYLPAAPVDERVNGWGGERVMKNDLSPLHPLTPVPVRFERPATILLVDDEGMIRTLARAVLEQAGHAVLEAEDGAEAVEVFRRERHRLDLVILDLTMPRLSGRDAFRQMVAIDPAARVLFSSGYTADDLSEVDGAKGLLSKPYRPPDLLAAVRRALAEDLAGAGCGAQRAD